MILSMSDAKKYEETDRINNTYEEDSYGIVNVKYQSVDENSNEIV